MDNDHSLAAAIFARHGIDFATVQQAGGWTNAVWLADGLVLRLSKVKDNDSLLREARLAARFPPAVGYPEIVEVGTASGFAWSLAVKCPGMSLEDAWADLGWETRAVALKGLWERARAVHTIPASELAGMVPERAWFNSNDAPEAEAGLARLTTSGILTEPESRVLRGALDRFWRVEPVAPRVLCHGDLTPGNVLWHAGQVVALLDFEFAVMAPAQLDLNHLVKCAFGPCDSASTTSPADLHGAQRLRQTVRQLAAPMLAQPGSRRLLMGYAILLELWLLELWLAHLEGEGPLEQWEPLRRLRSLADGAGGYLAPLVRDRKDNCP